MKSILGSLSRERVLTFIATREERYASEIVKFWNCPDRPIKRELNELEASGVISAKSYGKTIVYSLNPRYYLRNELKALLLKIVNAYPPEIKEELLYSRRRESAKSKDVKWMKELEK